MDQATKDSEGRVRRLGLKSNGTWSKGDEDSICQVEENGDGIRALVES
jgi:hypothetical protein